MTQQNQWSKVLMWRKTRDGIGVLSNLTNQTQVQVMHSLVSDALEQLKQEKPELVTLINEQLKQQQQ